MRLRHFERPRVGVRLLAGLVTMWGSPFEAAAGFRPGAGRLGVRLLAGLLLAAFLAAAAERPLPVFLDTDIGDDIDDALALALALESPELKVLGISTVLQDGARRADLVWRILQLYGRTDIPVGSGAEWPLIAPPRTGPVRQVDALRPQDSMPAERRRNGVELLIETCLHSTEKVTLVAYGPLTNIALALRSEPRLRDRIERIVLMNGVFFRPGLEYNTKMDPEASAIVYSSGLPVTAVGLDVTMQCELTAEHLRRFAQSPLENVQFLWKLIQIWQGGNASQRPILHDPLSVAVTVKPDLVSTVAGTVSVELKGTPEQTYGMTVFRKSAAGVVRVAQEVSSAAAVEFFMQRVVAAPR
jgi:purine nucleosidase